MMKLGVASGFLIIVNFIMMDSLSENKRVRVLWFSQNRRSMWFEEFDFRGKFGFLGNDRSEVLLDVINYVNFIYTIE